MSKDILVGIDYFTGWWPQLPNFWTTGGHDWRSLYPERIPLLGCYNDQATMDAEIVAASTHGVDFFLILWYPGQEFSTDNFGQLNNGISLFMNSPEAHRMRFAAEYCNHEPYPPLDNAIWERQCRVWCGWFAHPSYLNIGGKPFFKIHGIHHFLTQHDGDGVAAARRIERLRQIVREECGCEPLVCAGAVGDEPIQGALADVLAQCDIHGTYGELPDLPQQEELYPYETLLAKAEERWAKSIAQPFLPYMPFLTCGWEPRPWKDNRASFALPNRSQWTTALQKVKVALEHAELRVPDGTAQGQKMFTIYSWNEFGEGGFAAPTAGDEYMKLECIREVFGTNK